MASTDTRVVATPRWPSGEFKFSFLEDNCVYIRRNRIRALYIDNFFRQTIQSDISSISTELITY